MAVVVGALGEAKIALIAAQPIPLAAGALIRGGRGGVFAQMGEGTQDELVMPLETGVKSLAGRLADAIGGIMFPGIGGAQALAGAGIGAQYHTHYEIGALIGDDRSLKEFDRRLRPFRESENQRRGVE
jgi:hypothetical protein